MKKPGFTEGKGPRPRSRRVVAALFPIFAVVDGVVCLLQPEFLRESMLALSMPTYMLYILGAAKIAGGAVLLLPTPILMKEWAWAGFTIWWVGGMLAHLFSSHSLAEFVPLAVVGVLLLLSFLDYRPRREFMRPAA